MLLSEENKDYSSNGQDFSLPLSGRIYGIQPDITISKKLLSYAYKRGE